MGVCADQGRVVAVDQIEHVEQGLGVGFAAQGAQAGQHAREAQEVVIPSA